MTRSVPLLALGLGALSSFAACTAADVSGQPADPQTQALTSTARVSPGNVNAGRSKFNGPLQHTNGRACGTCHLEGDSLALTAASAQALFASDPTNPLFDPLDSDVEGAATPTYENLKKGLIRIKLRLPDNVDLIAVPPDAAAFSPIVLAQWKQAVAAGQIPEIVTPADRMITVWRGVPSVNNTEYTAPYLSDGREETLEAQALGALQAHSALSGSVGNGQISLIAQFERSQFANDVSADVANRIATGVSPALNELPEDSITGRSASWERGRLVYKQACIACHGGIADNRIVNRAVHDALFFQLDHEGNIVFKVPRPETGAQALLDPAINGEFLNIGTAFLSYLGQVTKNAPPQSRFVTFTQSINLPRYRLRFYADGTRQQQVTDLPPLPAISNFSPLVAANDRNGNPITGPNFGPQLFTTDPGRALISGKPADFEAIDVPQLRGIAHTAPYFHDNSMATLSDLIDIYSRFILPFLPQLGLPTDPSIPVPVIPGNDILSATQKADLLEFLQTF